MKIELSRDQYIELLQAVFSFKQLKKAYYEQNGQEYPDDSTLGEYLLTHATQYKLDVPDSADKESWIGVLEEQGSDMLESYVTKQFWEKLAWDLALTMYDAKHPGHDEYSEEKFLAVTELSNQFLAEFEANRLSNVSVKGIPL